MRESRSNIFVSNLISGQNSHSLWRHRAMQYRAIAEKYAERRCVISLSLYIHLFHTHTHTQTHTLMPALTWQAWAHTHLQSNTSYERERMLDTRGCNFEGDRSCSSRKVGQSRLKKCIFILKSNLKSFWFYTNKKCLDWRHQSLAAHWTLITSSRSSLISSRSSSKPGISSCWLKRLSLD